MAGRRSSSGAHAAQADQQGQQQQPEGRPKRKAAELTLQRIHAQANGSRAATTNQDAAPDADTSSAKRARGRPRRSATGGAVSTGSSSTSAGRDGTGAAAPTAARAGTKDLHDYRPRRMEIGGKAPRKLLSAAAIRKLEKAKQKASEADEEEATSSKRARTTSKGASTVSVGMQCEAVAVLDEEHITCHVCMEVMHRPTMLVPCGHMACRSCIVAWLGTNTAECSMCRTRTSHMTESYEMRAIIATYLESHPEAARSAEDVAAMIRKEDECKDRAEAALREVRLSTFLRRFPAEARADNDYARRVKMAVDCVFRPTTRRSAQGVAQAQAGQGQAAPAAAGDGPVVAPAVVLVQRRAAAGAAAAQP